ncbi:MAG TPA: RluA family pseudouridine synthase [Acidimicrobiales bacterium]|nr:RluA family pseudouridine synthase [Acidimicrobiales bacterium]
MSGPDPFDGEVLDLSVPAGLDGLRVDRALSMLTGLSRAQAHDVLVAGALTLDDRVIAKPSHLVSEGQHLVAVLALDADVEVMGESDVLVDVVLEDPDFLVVDKAPGMVVHPGAGQRHGTLVAGLLARYPEMAELSRSGPCDPGRPGVVHRLDKGTSGLLVVARTPEGFDSLSSQMTDRLVARTYVGAVEGHVSEDRGEVDAPIGRSPRTPTMMAVRADGRPARTHYEVVTRIESPTSTVLRLTLETGRTHQIRVHLAAIGHPVINDARYGHRRDTRLDSERVFLHASALGFSHPRTGEPVRVTSALPADLAPLVPAGVSL